MSFGNILLKIARKKGNATYVRKEDIWERIVERRDILRKKVIMKKAIKRNRVFTVWEKKTEGT